MTLHFVAQGPPSAEQLQQIAELVIPIVGIVFGCLTTMVLGLPIIRAIIRRVERRNAPPPAMAADLSGRLERIEQTVDSIALEVERVSEGQRFLTRLQTEQKSVAPPTSR